MARSVADKEARARARADARPLVLTASRKPLPLEKPDGTLVVPPKARATDTGPGMDGISDAAPRPLKVPGVPASVSERVSISPTPFEASRGLSHW